MLKQFTLGKNERLKSRKSIEELFNAGKRFHHFPFRVFYKIIKRDSGTITAPLLFGAGVSGKYFRKAVDRNRIKRLTRESYRMQKLFLQEKLKEKNLQLHLFIIYSGKELPVYRQIAENVAVILKKLARLVNENPSPDT